MKFITAFIYAHIYETYVTYINCICNIYVMELEVKSLSLV